MATEVILPRVDMDMSTGRIARWYIEEGAAVEKGQPLFEIETDKAAMEIEAPGSGILRKVALGEEQSIPVGSTVGWICGPEETIDQKPVASATKPTEPQSSEGKVDGGAPAEAVPDAVSDAIPNAVPGAVPGAAPGSDETPLTTGGGGIAATPLARRLARQHDIGLASVKGSGPRRRVQARDVEQAVQAAQRQVDTKSEPRPSPVPISVATPPRHAPTLPTGLNRVWLREGEGRPLVLIHGFGGELSTWRPLVASLPLGRPVLAVDLPGHGSSPALQAPSLAGLAEAVAEALAEDGVAAIDLIAHSLGGAVATEIVDSGALDIRSLFLMAPAGLGPEINGDFIAGFNRARSEQSLAPWLRLLVTDAEAMSPAFIRATARLREDEAVVRAQEALASALFPDGTQAISIRPALERIDIPVRIVFGTGDRIIPPHHASAVPGLVAVHRIPGIGHMPYLEARPLLARILAHHLRGVDQNG